MCLFRVEKLALRSGLVAIARQREGGVCPSVAPAPITATPASQTERRAALAEISGLDMRLTRLYFFINSLIYKYFLERINDLDEIIENA